MFKIIIGMIDKLFWSIRIRKGIIDSLFKFNSLADQIRRTNSRTVPLGIK